MPISPNLARLFWSDDKSSLDTQKHKSYIIHHVLLHGTFADIRELIALYSQGEVIRTFINHPSKIYPKKIFNFIKNYILGIRGAKLDEQDYITSVSGPLRQRTAGRFQQT